jgi:hypothetical protein
MKNHLQAYRFSEQEINKMIELKKIFEENGFEIDRFPEVYYDDYDNYDKVKEKREHNYAAVIEPSKSENQYSNNQDDFLNKIKDLNPNNNNIGDFQIDAIGIIDLLGVYTNFWITGDKINTKEGVIVLFKDRIESLGLDKNNVRFIVLIHELGHWLSHWPKCDGENWSKGYYAGIEKKTHESLAQLIAFWSANGNPELEKTLTYLTPTDINNPYYLYNNLKTFSKSDILKKLIELRNNWNYESDCKDLVLYEFLKCQYINFNDFTLKESGFIAGLGYGI